MPRHPWHRVATLVAGVSLACLWLACGGATPTEDSAAEPMPETPAEAPAGLEVRNTLLQWVPGMEMASVYFEVVNPGAADRLLRVESPLASQAETHETVADGDTLRMEARPEGFEVPAGGTLTLEPGGKHIMLIGPTAPAEGEGLPLTLHFASGTTLDVVLAVGAEHAGIDHSAMDHSAMDHSEMDQGTMDHSEMDHGTMDHSDMDHSGMDHGSDTEAEPSDPGTSTDAGGGA